MQFLFNSKGDWVAFRKEKFVYNTDGKWIGWLPWDESDVVSVKGEYPGFAGMAQMPTEASDVEIPAGE